MSTTTPAFADQAPQTTEDERGEPSTKDVAKAALAELLAPVRSMLLTGKILGAISGVAAVVPFVALVQLGDILLAASQSGSEPDSGEINRVVMLLLGGFSFRLFVYFVALMVTHVADVRLHRSIRSRILKTLSTAPLSWFGDNTSGQVRKVIQDDVVHLHVMVAHKPVDYTVAVVMPVSLGIYAFVIDWRLGLLALALIPIYFSFYAFMMRGMGEKTAELDRRLDQLSGTMIEFISGIAVVKAFGIVGKAHKRYSDQADDTVRFYEEWARPMLRGAALATAIISAPMVMLVVFGGGWLLVRGGYVSPVEVVTVAIIALALPQAMETFGNLTWGAQMAGAAAARILATLDAPTLNLPQVSRAHPADASIDLDDVTLRYGQTVAVQDVTEHLPAGTVTALVGPSGSGKSTLAKLVARFQDPDSGRVCIGGVDLRDLTEDELFQNVAFVLQDAQLVRASVHDNITLARPGASRDEVAEAAKAAQIHEEIMALPHGYDTIIGTDTHLSGGQQQRVAIARAILADRPVLLLDEATAMTDPESEADIQHALNALVKDKTVLVIAHRPAAIAGADRIILMDRGRVDAAGTHDELRNHPHYRQLWDSSTGTETQS